MHPVYLRLRIILKTRFDQIRNEQLKKNLLQAFPFWLASVITGLVAVCYSKLFLYAEKTAAWLYTQPDPYLMWLCTPAFFLLAVWVVRYFAPLARGSGIPQVMAAIELSKPATHEKVSRLLSMRIIIVKIVSSCLLAAGGGITGREGPTIQIAGSIFRKINSLLPDWWPKVSKRNMVVTGAAAGLAAAFNTPLGGIVFAMEELSRMHISFYKTAIFSAVIIAGLTAQALLGPYLYIGYPALDGLPWKLFPLVLCVAVAAGLSGSILCKLILLVNRWKNRLLASWKQMVYIVCCAIVVVAMAKSAGILVMNSGKELMTQLLFTDQQHISWYIPVFRMIGSLVSFTTGAAGGVFAPALAAGASIGSVVSNWCVLSPMQTNLLILAGMVGFLTGVTRSPFTSAILVLEMTDVHHIIFYLLLAALTANLVAQLIDRKSFYDHMKESYIREVTAQ
jgi:H+/Cl- antiporter ClcA